MISPAIRNSIFFFFQAEDGIRDTSVTGVQTCALPISVLPAPDPRPRPAPRGPGKRGRSEERRVGKECRSRWTPYNLKKKRDKRNNAGGASGDQCCVAACAAAGRKAHGTIHS